MLATKSRYALLTRMELEGVEEREEVNNQSGRAALLSKETVAITRNKSHSLMREDFVPGTDPTNAKNGKVLDKGRNKEKKRDVEIIGPKPNCADGKVLMENIIGPNKPSELKEQKQNGKGKRQNLKQKAYSFVHGNLAQVINKSNSVVKAQLFTADRMGKWVPVDDGHQDASQSSSRECVVCESEPPDSNLPLKCGEGSCVMIATQSQQDAVKDAATSNHIGGELIEDLEFVPKMLPGR